MVKSPNQTAQTDVKSPPEVDYSLLNLDPKPRVWKRLIIGGVCVLLGVSAAAVGLGSITYRLTHMTVNAGLVNGRTVRLQAPVDGTIEDFYARPGVTVQAGQVLARIEPLPQEDTSLTQFQQEVETYSAQLAAARQTLDLMTQQLQELESQDQVLQTANVAIATEDVSRYQADLEAAIAQEKAHRSTYERHQQLLAQGAVSRQQVEELKATWESAQAAVQAAEAERNAAQVSRTALDQGALTQGGGEDLQSQQRSLVQSIQEQATLIKTLEVQLQGKRNQLEEVRSRYGNDPTVEIKAPFAGIVYGTEHDTGEQVNRPATLLSLLDCNDLWVETLVRLDQANRIDTAKPVRVQISSDQDTVIGQVEVVEAMSQGELTKARAEALYPAVPPQLVGQPLARVRVRIPPTPDQATPHRFCGVGQSASLTFGLQLFAAR